MTERARTIFLGSGSFAVPIVAALADHQSVELIAVVTAPTRAGSRGRPTDPPVAEWAIAQGVPMLRPARLRAPESIADIEALSPDLLVLADYGQIVPKVLLDMPPYGALNVHPSLLPRHRGATPIPATILAGDAESGVTLMVMDEGMDTGPVIIQDGHALDRDETAPQLEDELAREGALLLAETLDPWLQGAIEPTPQHHAAATFTRPLRRADGWLDPSKTADELERQIRAYQPWPGSFVETDAGRLVVWRAHIADRGTDLGLQAADRYLAFDDVQLAGGKRMTADDLRRGRPGLQIEPLPATPDASG